MKAQIVCRILPLVCGVICVVLSSGCINLTYSGERRGREAMPDSLAKQFARSPLETVTNQRKVTATNDRFTVHKIDLGITTPERGTNFTLVLEYYQPKPNAGRLPVILLLPMAGGSYPVEHYFGKYFARHGFAVVLLHRRKFPHKLELTEINPWIVASMQDGLRAVDWIEKQPELDSTRIGLLGISTGGLKGTLLAAVDPRIKASVLGLAADDLPYVLVHSAERNVAKMRKRLLTERNCTTAELEEELRRTIHWDPNQFGPYLDPDKVMLVLALFDRVVPFKKGWELREKLDKPATFIVPTGHYTAALAIPCILRQSLHFLRRELAVELPRNRLHSPRDTQN